MAQAMTHISLTPLPERNNLLKALQMLITDDPMARVFVKGLLKAFGAPIPTEKQEQIHQLLWLWDKFQSQNGTLSTDEQIIIDQARALD